MAAHQRTVIRKDMDALKKSMQSFAQVFNDIILDDWLFTTSTDEKSMEERGDLVGLITGQISFLNNQKNILLMLPKK